MDSSLAEQFQIQAENPLPLAVVIVASVAIVMLISWFYYRERGRSGRLTRTSLAVIRCALLFLVMWMLFAYSQQRWSIAKPILSVVIDSSDSMATQDEAGGPTRYAEAVSALNSLPRRIRKSLEKQYDTRWFRISSRAENASADWQDVALLKDDRGPATEQSRLGDGITQIVRSYGGGSLAGIVLLSDGVNTGGRGLEAAARDARNYGVPISTIAVGRGTPAPDVRIVELMNDREVYAGDDVVVTVNIALNNQETTRSTLKLVDEDTAAVIDQTELRITDGYGVAKLTMPAPEVGVHALRVELQPLDGEENLANNQASTTVRVTDSTIRVLMVFQRPSYEFRFLKHWLERSRGVGRSSPFQLDCVLQSAEADYVRQDDSAVRLVPTSAEELAAYDAFIFGDCRLELISRGTQQRIVNAITENGAGCVLLFGQDEPTGAWAGEPLGELIPADVSVLGADLGQDFGGFRWEMTRAGAALLPALASDPDAETTMPIFDSLCAVDRLKPGVQVVAQAVSSQGTQPLLLSQYSGAGRVFTQLTDESFRIASMYGGDAEYQKYWLNVLRWCTKGRLASERGFDLTVSPKQLRLGNSVSVAIQFSRPPSDPPVAIARSGAESISSIELAPSVEEPLRYVGAFEPSAVGSYEIAASVEGAVDQQTKRIEVLASNVEQDELLADRDMLARVAQLSGGEFYEIEQVVQAMSQLPAGRSVRLGALPPKPLWNHPIVAAAFMMMLTVEWILRRRARML